MTEDSWISLQQAAATNDGTRAAYFPVNSTDDKMFWRVAVEDMDSDGDGLTNAEECKLGTNRQTDQTIADIPDLWLGTHFTAVLLNGGLNTIDPNGDPDGDGLTNVQEAYVGTNPNVSDNPGIAQESIVNGYFASPVIGNGNRSEVPNPTWDYWGAGGVQGWTAVTGQNIELQKIESTGTNGQYCELKAHPQGHYGIRQRVGTRKGRDYLLFLDCKARQNTNPAANAFSVYINGVFAQAIIPTSEWSTRPIPFTATASVSQISLIPIADPNDTMGCLVDNVKLAPVILNIWNGQDVEQPVADKYNTGAFTVANLNDTNGNAIPDKDETFVYGEKDLMMLHVGGYAGLAGKVKLTVKSGSIKLWEQMDKQTEVALTDGSVFFDIQSGGVDKLLWIEATAVSGSVRDIEIWESYIDPLGNLTDGIEKVRATAVWAEIVSYKNQSDDVVWEGASDDIVTFFDENIFSFGNLFYCPTAIAVHYGIGFEFKVLPDDVKGEPGVRFDVTRQHEGVLWSIAGNAVTTRETASYPDIDEANDDGFQEDEDNDPAGNGRLYSVDSPGLTWDAARQYQEIVMKFNFNEFVRVWFKDATPEGNNSDGSRCSDKQPWHTEGWVEWEDPNQPHGPNDFPRYKPKDGKINNVNTGEILLTEPQP